MKSSKGKERKVKGKESKSKSNSKSKSKNKSKSKSQSKRKVEVKVQVMVGTRAIQKINTIRVTPDTGATADLISNMLANSLGCKIRKDNGEYHITDVNKKELRISRTTTVKLCLPNGDLESAATPCRKLTHLKQQ